MAALQNAKVNAPRPPSTEGAESLTASRQSDLFADEDRTNTLMKSLINQQGLHSAWQRLAGRIQSIGQGLEQVQGVVGRLPQEYVALADYRNIVENKHAVLLNKHGALLDGLDDLTLKLSDTVFENHTPMLAKILERVQAVEEDQALVRAQTDDAIQKTQALQQDIHSRMLVFERESERYFHESREATKRLQCHLHEKIKEILEKMRATEERSQHYTNIQIEKTQTELTKTSGADGMPTQQQQLLLDLVKQYLTSPLAERIDHIQEVCEQTYDETEKHKELWTRDLKAAQKTSVDAALKVRQIGAECSREFADRPRKQELTKLQFWLQEQVQDIIHKNKGMQTLVNLKLSEFFDHFVKVHETIDDHEHCLRHHAEELENRATKYELLTIQYQVDRCALKEEVVKETAELKRVQDWHSGKINGFTMAQISPLQRRRRSKSRRTSRMNSTASTVAGLSRNVEILEEDGGNPSPDNNSLSVPRLGIGLPIQGFGVSPAECSLSENGEEEEGQMRGLSAVQDQDEEDDDGGPSKSESEVGRDALMRDQLEAMSMALVGLGHLAFKETKLGTSRNARLLQERDMLEELKNLRHWISNRMAPSGWDPSILTTVALRCTHLREDEHQKPLPQLPLHTPARSHHMSTASSGSGRV